MKYLLLFFSITFHGQVLHHQMLSSQGMSTKTSNGLIISQTIGQQSLTGTSSTNFVLLQGFQQSVWGKYIASNKKDEIDALKTITYPNPFTEFVNFQFSQPVTESISINVFDIVGRLIFQQNKKSVDNILTIDLALLPNSEYLVQLKTTNLTYYTKIIKQ